jgi:uncharacterized CHY-type Zn-finger protein
MKKEDSDQKIEVKGKIVDDNTRCIHYHSALDVIAIKFKCCGEYYPCYECHEEDAGHTAEVWKKEEWNYKAILCGICKNEISIQQYLASGDYCPNCNAAFNPGCSKHYHLYFEL